MMFCVSIPMAQSRGGVAKDSQTHPDCDTTGERLELQVCAPR